MDKTKIIVVEDNIVYCEFVCNLLAREGFHTVQASRLSTTKKFLLQATENDIIVSDSRLPEGDGIGLSRWMRKEGMVQPFIIMTDYAEVHTTVESTKLGSLGYIPRQLVFRRHSSDTSKGRLRARIIAKKAIFTRREEVRCS